MEIPHHKWWGTELKDLSLSLKITVTDQVTRLNKFSRATPSPDISQIDSVAVRHSRTPSSFLRKQEPRTLPLPRKSNEDMSSHFLIAQQLKM
jgi:hypothetical protein